MLVGNEAGSLTTLTRGYEDEVLTVTQPNGTLVTMTYDGDLKRRKRAQANWWNSYLWDREQVVLELDKNDNTIARYTLAPFGYGDLVSQRRSDVTSFSHFDAIGTTRALTDADQDVTDSYIMRAFGTYRTTTGSTVNNFRYIGKLGYYRETALSGFYLRRRYYAPEVGRFVSRDPARTAGTSRYRYAGNRATRFVNAGGLQALPSPISLVPIIPDPRPRLPEPQFPPLPPKVTLPPGEPTLPWCPPRLACPIGPRVPGPPIRRTLPPGPIWIWPGPLPGGMDLPIPQPSVNRNEPVWAPIEWTPAQRRWWRLVNALIAQKQCQGFYDILLHGGAAVSVVEDAIQTCCWDILGELGALGKAGGAAMEACEDALYELLGRGRPR